LEAGSPRHKARWLQRCRPSTPIKGTNMRIGVPKETKTLEGRVALVPAAAGDLV
jgi:hypothetical protein